jgi:hypothetical protein
MNETVTVSIPTSFADAKALLLQSDDSGNSLYNHLTELILKVLETKPKDALKDFENISGEIKKGRLDIESTTQPVDIQQVLYTPYSSFIAKRRGNNFRPWIGGTAKSIV